MMQKLSFLFSVLLLLSLSAFAQSSTQNFTTDGGAPIEVVLRPAKETLMLGETTFINFEVTNFSDKDICMTAGGDYRNNVGRPDSYKVAVVGENGKAVPQPEVKFSMGGLIGCHSIKPRGTYVTRLFLPHWATFSEPGTYKISVRKNLSLHAYGTQSRNSYPVEVGTSIKIIPTDKEKLGEVIDSLGKAMDDDSASLLGFIDDPRTVKYFAPYLEKKWGVFTSRIPARSIARYDTEEAWQALEKAMRSDDEEVRFSIADALSFSNYPRALKLLLTMKNDSYWFVRIRVVQGFGQVNTEESNALLREMLKDENESVRMEAKRFLDERGLKY